MKCTAPIINATVLGNLPRKSNSRRIFRSRKTGKTISIKSEQALAYEELFLASTRNLPALDVGEKDPVELQALIYYQSRRSDLSDELLADLIEKAGIITNDRQIFKKTLIKRIDPARPRVVFQLKKFIDTGAEFVN